MEKDKPSMVQVWSGVRPSAPEMLIEKLAYWFDVVMGKFYSVHDFFCRSREEGSDDTPGPAS